MNKAKTLYKNIKFLKEKKKTNFNMDTIVIDRSILCQNVVNENKNG